MFRIYRAIITIWQFYVFSVFSEFIRKKFFCIQKISIFPAYKTCCLKFLIYNILKICMVRGIFPLLIPYNDCFWFQIYHMYFIVRCL